MAILVRNLGGTVNEKPAMMISVDDHEKLGPELEAYFPEKMFFTLEELKAHCDRFERCLDGEEEDEHAKVSNPRNEEVIKAGSYGRLSSGLDKDSEGNEIVDLATVTRLEDGWYVTRLERVTSRMMRPISMAQMDALGRALGG